jgi:WD repeat-containing protein 92
MKLVTEMEKKSAFKCGTFGTSSDSNRKLSTGNFDGHLQIWDMEKPVDPVFSVQAHASIVNAVDGCGGMAKGSGPPELVTCGRDGCVRVWDPRQESAPVAAFQPSNKENVRCLCSYLSAGHLENIALFVGQCCSVAR